MLIDVIVRDAGKRGKGVFSTKSFKKGEFVFRYRRGRIVHGEDLARLSKDDLNHLNELDGDAYEIMRSPEKFVNHSCNPNTVNKGRSVIAIKAIRKGEEGTADDRIKNGLFHNRWRCYCGSKNCTGWVTSDFFSLPARLQKKYLPYTIDFIRRECTMRPESD